MKDITLEELSQHNTEMDLWVAIDGQVFDLTNFINKHPGGREPILKAAGKDISNYFHHIVKHKEHPNIFTHLQQNMCIGRLI